MSFPETDEKEIETLKKDRAKRIRWRLRTQRINTVFVWFYVYIWMSDALHRNGWGLIWNTVMFGIYVDFWWTGPFEGAAPWALKECPGSYRARRVT